MRQTVLGLLAGLLYPAFTWGAVGVLENPLNGSHQSGIRLVSGWVCIASRVDIVFDGTITVQAAYGTSREDTRAVCGDDNNGFGLLFNWNLLGDGSHTVSARADGVEFGSATFTVTTLGSEFLTGQSAICTTALAGKNVTLSWEEPQQNFVITGASAGGVNSGTYALTAAKISDTCSVPQTGATDTLTVTQSGSTLAGTIQSTPGFQYAGEADGFGDFLLSQTTLKTGTSSGCTFLAVIYLSGNFPSGAVTVSLARRRVNGICPSIANCDVVLSGTLTKTSFTEGELSESLRADEGAATVDEVINALLE